MAQRGRKNKTIRVLMTLGTALFVSASDITYAGEISGNCQMSITIDGGTSAGQDIELFVFDSYFRFRRELDARQFKGKDEKWMHGISIPLHRRYTYARIAMPEALSPGLRNPWFFLMPGDSLHIMIKNGKPEFYGKGSERLSCLWKLFNIDWMDYNFRDSSGMREALRKKSRHLYGQKKHLSEAEYEQQSFVHFSEVVEYLYQRKINLLQQYEEVLDSDVFDFIRFECLVWKAWQIKARLHSRKYLDGLANTVDLILSYDDPADEVIHWERQGRFSMLYADYLAVLAIEAIYKQNRVRNKVTNFVQIDEYIRTHYQSAKYEKVITAALAHQLIFDFRYRLDEAILRDLKCRIQDKRYGSIIESYRKALSPEFDATGFTLKDMRGNPITFEQFHGQLLVLDFWFTGCPSCIKMAKAMEPVIEHFQEDSRIAFISVNLDRSRNLWLTSLKKGLVEMKGKYSHDHNINISTYPHGFMHPFPKALNIVGAPELMLLAGDGKILLRNPPLPTEGETSVKLLINMLEERLK